MKTLKRIFKIILFFVIFFVISMGLSFLLKDDLNSYTRTLTHEFYSQDQIDVIFCGASHVSHGIDPRISDKRFNQNTFNTGTPSQGINGTYAIIKQAVKEYDIQTIFLETDFAVACRDISEKKMGTSDFLVESFLKDPAIKTQFIFENSSPSNILNAVLPIGKDKLLTLNPKKILKKIKSLITKEYFDYSFGDDEAGYAGKGCVLDYAKIENGTFNNYYQEPKFSPISDSWKFYIEKIIQICKENDVNLIFYSMPCSDFYLNEKGDYDKFYFEIKNYLNDLGFDYFDFNLCKKEYLDLQDEDFSDDNHLNITGVEKFTNAFCNFFTDSVSSETLFYSSYNEKMDNLPPTCFGLVCIISDDGKEMSINPVTNIKNNNEITFNVSALYSGTEVPLIENSNLKTINLPPNTSGKIQIECFVNGNKSNFVQMPYAAF